MDLSQENIISLLDIGTLPDERKVAIVEKATELVQKRLLVRVFENLDEVKRKELNKLIDHGQNKEISDFITANSPDFPTWIDEEVLKVKQELADLPKE